MSEYPKEEGFYWFNGECMLMAESVFVYKDSDGQWKCARQFEDDHFLMSETSPKEWGYKIEESNV